MLKFNMTDWNVASTQSRELVVFNVHTKEFTGSITVFQDKGSDILSMCFLELGSDTICFCNNMSEKTFIEIMLEIIEPTPEVSNAPIVGERAPADNLVANCAVFSKN